MLLAALIVARDAFGNSERVVDLKTTDGTVLKGTYFAAAKPGPSVLLFHQSNRTRKSWEDIARQLGAVGINALTVDTDPKRTRKQRWPGDLDAVFEFLVSQPGVNRDVVGIGGAGVLGVEDSVEAARRHPAEVKSLVLLSGETESLDFLRQASQLPELFVVADNDEYPPIVEAMELLYVTASSPSRKFVHYSASHEAPWLWYEPFDIGKVPAKGGHGAETDVEHPTAIGVGQQVHFTLAVSGVGGGEPVPLVREGTEGLGRGGWRALAWVGGVVSHLAPGSMSLGTIFCHPELVEGRISCPVSPAGTRGAAIDIALDRA